MIVPFAMPLLIGPGAISTAIIYASQARVFGFTGTLIGLAVMAGVAISCFLSFVATPVITRLLGKVGMTIVVRVLGLILCAMAVQFLLAGLSDSTIGLIRHSAAVPYPDGDPDRPAGQVSLDRRCQAWAAAPTMTPIRPSDNVYR